MMIWSFQLTRSRGAWPIQRAQELQLFSISTHTLTWSVTTLSVCMCYHIILISTHTLTWSVTIWLVSVFEIVRISTHTLTWSVTCQFCHMLEAYLWFQLTRSRGAWPQPLHHHSNNCYFNSHAHVERDPFFSWIVLKIFISTHTLTWSVTVIVT